MRALIRQIRAIANGAWGSHAARLAEGLWIRGPEWEAWRWVRDDFPFWTLNVERIVYVQVARQ